MTEKSTWDTGEEARMLDKTRHGSRWQQKTESGRPPRVNGDDGGEFHKVTMSTLSQQPIGISRDYVSGSSCGREKPGEMGLQMN